MAKKLVQLHRKIAPDMIATIEERYAVLRHVQYSEPVGRRALAAMLQRGERAVRAQVDFLKDAGLLDFSPVGMSVTAEGQMVLDEVAEYIKELHGLSSLEEKLSEKLGIRRIIIIPGDSDQDLMVRRELGKAACQELSQHMKEQTIIAVSGGSIMANVADSINFCQPFTTVVPARGGLGERVEYQANTIAANMANKLGGKYRLLHIPDGISEEMVEALLSKNEASHSVIKMIREADILVHGIGQAREMAVRRGFDEPFVSKLLDGGAVGEALGHYCTLDGKLIYITNSVGLHLEELNDIGTVIAVAGGSRKAQAIVAVTNAGGQDVLITDEAAARAIEEII